MKVVGLDIATVTGWCRFEGDRVTTGLIDCTPRTKGEPEGVRFERFALLLPDVLDGSDAAIIERTYSKGKRTAEVLNGLTAIALVALEARGIEYVFVDASALKAFAVGGKASKAEMVEAARQTLGRTLTHDEADAYWLCRYWQERMAVREAS